MSKITESAKGEMCDIRLPGCNRDTTTTVFCHINGAGMGLRHSDIEGAYGCSNCHDIVDGRVPRPEFYTRNDILLAHHEAAVRTRTQLLLKGLITIGD